MVVSPSVMTTAGAATHNAPSRIARGGRATDRGARGWRERAPTTAAVSNAGRRMRTAGGWAALRRTASSTCRGEGTAASAAGGRDGAASGASLAAIAATGGSSGTRASANAPDNGSAEVGGRGPAPPPAPPAAGEGTRGGGGAPG